jgi:hypothetical protein
MLYEMTREEKFEEVSSELHSASGVMIRCAILGYASLTGAPGMLLLLNTVNHYTGVCCIVR